MQAGTYLIGTIFLLCGLLAVSAAAADWDWFFNSANVRVLTGRMRRPAARILYLAIGCAIIIAGGYIFAIA